MTEALANLLSISSLIAFLLGVGATKGYYYVRCRMLDKSDPEHKPHSKPSKSLIVLWALVFLMTGVTGIQGYETANEVRQLAADTKECQNQFTEALIARARISADNDKWSAIQRKAIADWLREILLPPPDIAKIRNDDPNFGTNPRYVQWSFDVTTKYYNIIQEAQDEQDQNVAERAQHPLPEPSCGK